MVTSAPLRIELLGGFAVYRERFRIPGDAWRLRKARHIVKLLALAPGHRLHRDVIVDALWPDRAAAAAANNLHRTLHHARSILDPDRAIGQPPSLLALSDNLIELSPDTAVEVDVDAFRAAAAEARRLPTPERYALALACYAGDLLPEDRFEDWAFGPREELRRLRLDLLLEHAAVRTGPAEHQVAIEALVTAVAMDPTHEVAQTELIRRYALSGRRAQAIRQFEAFRNVLRCELGVEPPAGIEQFVRDLTNGRTDRPTSAGERRDAERRRGQRDAGPWLAPGQD